MANPYQPPNSSADVVRHTTLVRACSVLFWVPLTTLTACLIWHQAVSHLFHRQKSTQYIYGPYWEIAQSIAPPVICIAIVIALAARFAHARLTRNTRPGAKALANR